MALIERGHLASALQGRSPNDQIVEANHFSGCFQFGPYARMLVRGLLSVGQDKGRIADNWSRICGEVGNLTLMHEGNEVRIFCSELPGPMLVVAGQAEQRSVA